ncbi:MAG: M14 family zinc carboxypeptidase, partial [Chromatiales bacterium]|nr:M14 family zinc carboxypeptidase [Chromatiales bacterium]
MRRALAVLAMLVAGMAAPAAEGACRLNGASISNPDDPSCRDAMFRYVESATTSNDEVTLGYPVPLPLDSLTPVDGFRTYESLKARHQELAVMLDTVEAVPVGQSGMGETIVAYRMGDSDRTTPLGDPEPAVLVNGTIHAREWQSPEVVTGLMEMLALRSADGGIGQYLSDNLNVVILPILNIDGFRQTQRYPERFSADPDQP